MPFKPLSNALLSPYKAPIETHLYNYLITNNLRRLLNNSFFHPSPTFTLHILSIYFDEWWMLGGGCWVVGVNGFYKVHCKSTHHHPPTFNPSYHQHSTFITQHPSPNIQSPHIINTQHSTPITQHSIPTHHQHPTSNTHHPLPTSWVTHQCAPSSRGSRQWRSVALGWYAADYAHADLSHSGLSSR